MREYQLYTNDLSIKIGKVNMALNGDGTTISLIIEFTPEYSQSNFIYGTISPIKKANGEVIAYTYE